MTYYDDERFEVRTTTAPETRYVMLTMKDPIAPHHSYWTVIQARAIADYYQTVSEPKLAEAFRQAALEVEGDAS